MRFALSCVVAALMASCAVETAGVPEGCEITVFWEEVRVSGAPSMATPSGSCLPIEPPLLPDGRAACTLSEVLHDDDAIPCHDRLGREPDPGAPDDPRRCVIRQVLDGAVEPGWYYDHGVEVCGESVVLTGGAELAAGSTVRMECVRDNGECGG